MISGINEGEDQVFKKVQIAMINLSIDHDLGSQKYPIKSELVIAKTQLRAKIAGQTEEEKQIIIEIEENM